MYDSIGCLWHFPIVFLYLITVLHIYHSFRIGWYCERFVTCCVCVLGLIDNDESAETAALRELKEETGYKGEVVGVTPGKAESCLSIVYS